MRTTRTVSLDKLPIIKKEEKTSLKDKILQHLTKNPDRTPEQLYKAFPDNNPRSIRYAIQELRNKELIKKITCKCEQSHYFRVN